jgi:sulfonate transport system permease protein
MVTLLVWEALSRLLGVSSAGVKYVPSPLEVLKAFLAFAGYWPGGLGAEATRTGAEKTAWGAFLGLIYNSGFSLVRVLIGFVLGVVGGVGLGLLVSWSAVARSMWLVPANFLRMMPLLAMLPLFGLWFGRAEIGSILFVAFAVAVLLFVVTINAVEGVSQFYIDSAASLGASRTHIYRTVVVPATLPELKAGILLAAPFAWSAVIAVEIIGKEYGLGRILNFALMYAATEVVVASGLVAMMLAVASFFLMKWWLDYVTRWS